MPTVQIDTKWLRRSHPPGTYWNRNGGGLGIRVGKTKASWVWQKSGGSTVKLGELSEMGLKEAKQEASVRNGAHGKTPRPSTITLKEGMERLYARMETDHPGSDSALNMERMLNKHVSDWMSRPMSRITGENLRTLHERISRSTPSAANNVLRRLRAIHYYVQPRLEWPGKGYVRFNPEAIREDIVEDWPLWRETIERITGDNSVVRDWWLFVAFTGLRRSEALSIRWEDVKDDWLTIRDPKRGPRGQRKSFRLPLSKQALDVIERQPRCSEWVFPGDTTGLHLMEPRRRQVREAGLPSPHALRRSYATLASELGCPEPMIARFQNHTSAKKKDVTRRYIQTRDDPMLEWAQKIGDALEQLLASD